MGFEKMNYSTIPLRLAAALLLKRGEISLGEIRALPLVEDEDFALAIAEALKQQFDVERYERHVGGAMPLYDDVIQIVSLPHCGPKESDSHNSRYLER